MLVDHAEAECMGVLGIGDRLFAAADQHMKRAGPYFQLDFVQGCEIPKAHGHGDGVDAKRPARHRCFADDHDMAPISAVDVATAPNTPPCILIIFSAWS